MPWMMQMAGCAMTILIVAFVAWVGFWFFFALLVLGVLLGGWKLLHRTLVSKGILNPVPGVPNSVIIEEEETTITTIIDGDYTRVDDK